MKQVIQISDNAKQVFKYMELLKSRNDNVTIKDLGEANKILKIELGS